MVSGRIQSHTTTISWYESLVKAKKGRKGAEMVLYHAGHHGTGSLAVPS